jgi:hypothetical protein
MTLASESWRLRKRAKEALRAGDLKACLELTAEAERLHATESGRRLVNLARWLTAGESDEPRRSPDRPSQRDPESQAG